MFHKKRNLVFIAITVMVGLLNLKCSRPVKSVLPAGTIARERLLEDYDAMFRTIDISIPATYPSGSHQTIDSLRKVVRTEITNMTAIQFYRKVRPVISAYNDAHLALSSLVLFNELENHHGLIFPANVVIDKDVIIIKHYYGTDRRLKTGDTIQSINSVATPRLIANMLNFISGDGQDYKRKVLEERFASILWSALGFENTFKVSLKNGRNVSLKGVNIKEWESMQSRPPFQYTTIRTKKNKKVGLLRITSLAIEEKSKFKKFVDSTFKEIKQRSISHLIIDIRNNGGGSTLLARQLFDYITEHPYTVSWADLRISNHQLIKVPDSSLSKPENSPNKFRGKVYLLVNSRTMSSAHMLAAAFIYYKFGTSVGDKSSESMLISGEVRVLVLPNTKLELHYPVEFFTLPTSGKKSEKLIPDVLIANTPVDRLNNNDRQLNYCLSLVK